MSTKIARLLEVVTSPATGEVYITTAAGTLETVVIDGRWSHQTIQQKVSDEIQKRIKNGILKHNVGYAIYLCTGHSLQLQSIHIQSEFSHLPRKWL